MARESDEFIAELGDTMARYCGSTFCLVNVGAEDGYEASKLMARFPGSVAYCIEAAPSLPPCGGVTPLKGVIGERTGLTPFYSCGAESSNLNRGVSAPMAWVQQHRLDEFCVANGIEPPDALLIDTEGTTGQVLIGAGELLRTVRFICAEVQNDGCSWGGTPVSVVDELLRPFGLVRIPGGYPAGEQANRYWARV